MKSTAIKIENLTKNFGETVALNNVSLNIKQGEIFGLLGPNGAGKTTTIKILTGLLNPTKGKVTIEGIDINKNPQDAKKKFALVPDVPYLYKKLTGWEFMKFISRIYKLDKKDINQEIDRQLEIFNIKNAANDLVDSYSHGMKQRLLLASVMLRRPDIIILDEPMVGLDPEAARMVKNMFKKMAETSKTIFLSTHTLADAQELCSRIAIINQGKIIAQGTLSQLKEIADKIRLKENEEGLTSENLEDIYLSITKNA